MSEPHDDVIARFLELIERFGLTEIESAAIAGLGLDVTSRIRQRALTAQNCQTRTLRALRDCLAKNADAKRSGDLRLPG